MPGNPFEYSGGGSGAPLVDTGVPYVVGETVTLVARITTTNDGSGNDSWALWVNPLIGDEGSPLASSSVQTIDDFTRVQNRAGNGAGSATLENLVIADSFADVAMIPEPSTLTLLGLGGLGMLLRRRCARK